MEPFTQQSQLPSDAAIESWDDDEDFQGIENLQIRNASTTTMATTSSAKSSHHRDSIGSHISSRSDLDEEGDWQLLLPNDDEASTKNAIENAKRKGIPLPSNVPSSALLGGTIRRLGGRKVKKMLVDDWSEDIEMPTHGSGGLRLKMNDGKEFPESLRQVSVNATPSPLKRKPGMSFMERLQATGPSKTMDPKIMEKFKDDEDDLFGDVPTIKVAKSRSPIKIPNFIPLPPKSSPRAFESFDDDFELPTSGTLKLSTRREAPKTPAAQVFDDVDTDWAEGSQGSLSTSFGGVRRMGKSARSSSISARSPSVFSPSLSSCLTAESEDEGLDGLVLPDGPLQLQEALKKRMQNASPEPTDPMKVQIHAPTKDDFFEGLELGHGELFDSAKLTLNRNIKVKQTRQISPPRRPATSLTFTNKPPPAITRIPKPASGLERPRSKLEPVAEGGGPISHYRSTGSHLGSHSQQSSLTSIPTPTTSTHSPLTTPSTPSHRGLTTRTSRDLLRSDNTAQNTTQFLKNKRSLPAMSSNKPPASPARNPPTFQRPTSRNERPLRQNIPSRPKTPVDRSESSLAYSRKPPIPFLPAGGNHSQSHHIIAKPSRTFHRPSSSDSTSESNPANFRPASRLSERHRAHTPTTRRDVVSESLARAAASKRTVTKPLRRRGYGDGSELDAFDDLPTSTSNEAKYLKQPIGSIKGTVTSRGKLYSNSNLSSTSVARSDTVPRQPLSPQKSDHNLPSFARSTTASRSAREQRLGASATPQNRHIGSVENHPTTGTNWKAVVNAKTLASPRHKRSNKEPKKPQLIKSLGNSNETKTVNGMHWNPHLFRWEGNEHVLAPFDAPQSPKRNGQSPVTKPALIANPGSIKGVQVVGGMVFDPEKMRWLKLAPQPKGRSDSVVASFPTEDEDDPFAGIDDLEDETKSKTTKGTQGGKSANLSDDEPMVGEEFDVGPEFIRRQKHEEEKWTRKLRGWVHILGHPELALEARNDLRSLVMQ